MEKERIIGSSLTRSRLAFEWKIKLIVATKVAICSLIAGFFFIYWKDVFPDKSVNVAVFLVILGGMIVGTYHLPGVLWACMEFMVGATSGCLVSVIAYKVIGTEDDYNPNKHKFDHPNDQYSHTVFLWFYLVIVGVLDRFGRHLMYMKLGVLFYLFTGPFMQLPTLDAVSDFIYYFLVLGMYLACGLSVFVSTIFYPIFASQMVMPEVAEGLRDCRDLFSQLAYLYQKNGKKMKKNKKQKSDGNGGGASSSGSGGGIFDTVDWRVRHEKVSALEMQLAQRIERIRKYMKDANLEFWNMRRVKELQGIVLELTQLYNSLTVMSIAHFKNNSETSLLPSMHKNLTKYNTEIIIYLDRLIEHTNEIHYTDHLFSDIFSHSKGLHYAWPSLDKIMKAREDVRDEFREVMPQIAALQNQDKGNVVASAEILNYSSFFVALSSFMDHTKLISDSLTKLSREPKYFRFRILPTCLFQTIKVGLVCLLFLDFGLPIAAESKKKKTLTARFFTLIRSKKWGFPVRFATVVTVTFPWAVGLYLDHADAIHMTTTSRSWLMTAVIMITMPTLGATISRGVHRIIGTFFGAALSMFFGWAVFTAADRSETAKWVVMQIFLVAVYFIGYIIQQIPGTGYAGILGTLTIVFLPLPYFHAPDITEYKIVVPLTRLIYTSLTVLWVLVIYTFLRPKRSIDNMEMSFMDCICTSGRAFSTLIRCGLLKDPSDGGAGVCLQPEEAKEIEQALIAVASTIDSHHLMLQDTYWESKLLQKDYAEYQAAALHVKQTLQKLTAVYSIYGVGFSHEIATEVIKPMRRSMNTVMGPIQARVAKITAVRSVYAKQRRLRKNNAAANPLEATGGHSALLDNNNGSVRKEGPTSFQELLEDLDVVRHQLRQASTVEQYLTKGLLLELFRFYGIIDAMGEFVANWDELRTLILRMKIKKELGTEALATNDEDYLQEILASTAKDTATTYNYTGVAPSPVLSTSTSSLSTSQSGLVRSTKDLPVAGSTSAEFIGSRQIVDSDDDLDSDDIFDETDPEKGKNIPLESIQSIPSVIEVEQLHKSVTKQEIHKEKILQEEDKGGVFG